MRDLYLGFCGDIFQKQINVILLHCLWADIGSGAPLEPLRVNEFRNLIRGFAYEGYHFLSSEEVYQYYMGKTNIPSKSIYLTFDDGYTCAVYYGTPILQEYGARASISPEYNKLGDDSLSGRLSLNGLHAAFDSGVWDIDTHGYVGHGGAFPPGYISTDYTGQIYKDRLWIIAENRYMTDIEHKALIRADLQVCKDMIEPLTGKPIRIWPYPMGDYGQYGNDPTHIPALNFEVLDELGIIGFAVSGEKVTPYSARHKGRRIAFDTYRPWMGLNYSALGDNWWSGVVKVGDRYLVAWEVSQDLQWHRKDLSPDGAHFGLIGAAVEFIAYDKNTGEFFGTDYNYGVRKFDPYTRTQQPVFPQLYVVGIAIDDDYIYTVDWNNAITKVSRATYTSVYLGRLPSAVPAWGFTGQHFVEDGILYGRVSSDELVWGFDLNDGLKFVRRIVPPTQNVYEWFDRWFCTGDFSDWLSRRYNRIRGYKLRL